jgi:hypothetical protein
MGKTPPINSLKNQLWIAEPVNRLPSSAGIIKRNIMAGARRAIIRPEYP